MSIEPRRTRRNGVVVAALVATCLVMVGLTFAAVPLYSLFCRTTGYAGTPQRATTGAENTIDRDVVVRFDGNVQGLPWAFRPEKPQVTLKLGETTEVNFIAENHGTTDTEGTATFNVQPEVAGLYFNKIQCFCFTKQRLRPGEKIVMAVQFFVSPDMVKERDLNATRTITLSYTFFPVAGEGQPVAQATGDAAGKSL
jgi:cytochrome c oxidase assembly protein subunit 11